MNSLIERDGFRLPRRIIPPIRNCLPAVEPLDLAGVQGNARALLY